MYRDHDPGHGHLEGPQQRVHPYSLYEGSRARGISVGSGLEPASCPPVQRVRSGVLDREPRNVTGMVVSPLPPVRDMIDSTAGQWVASQQTPQGQQQALDRTVHLQRRDGVSRACGVVATGGRQGGRDEALIETHRSHKDSCQPSAHRCARNRPAHRRRPSA